MLKISRESEINLVNVLTKELIVDKTNFLVSGWVRLEVPILTTIVCL